MTLPRPTKDSRGQKTIPIMGDSFAEVLWNIVPAVSKSIGPYLRFIFRFSFDVFGQIGTNCVYPALLFLWAVLYLLVFEFAYTILFECIKIFHENRI